MSERIAGKVFRTPEEAPCPFTPAQLEAIKARFAAFNERRDAALAAGDVQHLPERFGDDLIGTEYEDEYRAKLEERKARGEYWDDQRHGSQ